MIIDKEYPATHSMSTAWYCVDMDGNVAIIDIDDNGPVPESEYIDIDTNVDEVFWDTLSKDEGNKIRFLNLKPEQIEPLLLPLDKEEDFWEPSSVSEVTEVSPEGSRTRKINNKHLYNITWSDAIIKIDMSKLDILIKALKIEKSSWNHAVCLSKESGLFCVDFFSNKKGVDLLEKNNVVLARYKAPRYDYVFSYDEEDEKDKNEMKEAVIWNSKFPVYLYRQDYSPGYEAAVKMNRPEHPLKIDQLPEELQKKVFQMPIHFNKQEKIQLAKYLPVSMSSVLNYIVYDKKMWAELKMEDGTYGYYNQKLNKLMTEAEMKPLLDSGEAAEYDYDNEDHQDLDY